MPGIIMIFQAISIDL